jgi:predicted nucleotidyltransferase component of viral defense system
MIEDVLLDKINDYHPQNALEQENVLQELMQHFVLSSLARAGFFSRAVFHGGTALRIHYRLGRFSEDLDFFLKETNPSFSWQSYLDHILRDCAPEGIQFEEIDKSNLDAVVKKAFLKTDSIGKILVIKLPFSRHPSRKIKIKLEIDTNPPRGSSWETHYLTFPVVNALTVQTLSCAFATKLHALLCRNYTKGRDWYDFIWYVSRRIQPDLTLLQNALYQQGPFADQPLEVTNEWYLSEIEHAILLVDWDQAVEDIRRFIPQKELPSLKLWNKDLFLYQLNQLRQIMIG